MPSPELNRLLAYVLASKHAAAVKGHLGFDDGEFEMGKACAYQDIERLLKAKGAVAQEADAADTEREKHDAD